MQNPKNPFTFCKEIVSSSNIQKPKKEIGSSSSSLQVETGSSSSLSRDQITYPSNMQKPTRETISSTSSISLPNQITSSSPSNEILSSKSLPSNFGSNMQNPRIGSSSSLQVHIGSSLTIPRNPFSFRNETRSTSSITLPIEDYDHSIKVGKKITDPITNDTYLLYKQIGSSCNGHCRVYRALYTACLETNGYFVPTGYVTLKIINKNLQESDELQNQVTCTRDNSRKLIGLEKSFTTEDLVCISLPYMNKGSLRYILSTRKEKKFPEDFIAIVLKEVVVGLRDELHVEANNPRAHKTLNAGDIFVHIDDATEEMLIKLAFEASVYDSEIIEENQNYNVGEASSSSSFLDVKSIFKWGAAPEVFGTDGSTNTIGLKYDIWLLGITALELAYGDIRVRNRGELDYIIRKIREKKRLPRSLEKLLMKRKAKLKKAKDLFKRKEKRVFSEEFESMVLACLCENTENRPTAKQLLNTPFFTTAIERFRRFVLNAGNNPEPTVN